MIKTSVNKVATIIEREQSRDRRMSVQRKSRSRLDVVQHLNATAILNNQTQVCDLRSDEGKVTSPTEMKTKN